MTIPTQMLDAIKAATPANRSELRSMANGLAVMMQLHGMFGTQSPTPAFRAEVAKHAPHAAAFRDMISTVFSTQEQSRLLRYGRERGTSVLSGLTTNIVTAVGNAKMSDPNAHVPKTTLLNIKNTLVTAANNVPPQYRQPFLELATRLQTTIA